MSVSLIQYKLNLSNVLQNNLIPWLRCNVKLAAGHKKARFNSVIIVLVHLLCLNFLCRGRRLPWNASLTPLQFYLRIAGVANDKNTIQTSSWCNTWIIYYSILHQTSPPEYSWSGKCSDIYVGSSHGWNVQRLYIRLLLDTEALKCWSR